MAAAKKSVSTVLEDPQEKTKVVRYDSPDGSDDEVLANSYVSKAAIKKLGNPAKIKVTIEAA